VGAAMSIHGLFIGNNYRGESAELPDCELDSENLAAAFEPYLASGRELLSASRRKMIAELAKLKKVMRPNDLAIVAYSGHGTTDMIGDKPAQGIISNDMEVIYEWELRAMLADLGQAILLSDSCFSGGLLRGRKKQRWVPVSHCFRREVTVPTRLPKKPHVRFLACRANETAASTGKGGAFTLAFLEAFEKRKDRATCYGLAADIKRLLPNKEYHQHPVYDATDKTFAMREFRSFRKKWNVPPKGVA